MPISLIHTLVAAMLLMAATAASQECVCGRNLNPINSTSPADGNFQQCQHEDFLLSKIKNNVSSICHNFEDIGDETCSLRNPNSSVPKPLPSFIDVDNSYVIYRLTTPTLNNTSCYPPQTFCGYNVKCGSEDLILYYINNGDFQDKDAITDKCVDEMSITREFHSMREVIICGKRLTLQVEDSNTPAEKLGYEIDNLQVKFHSSKHCQNNGFRMLVMCVGPDTYDQDDCTQSVAKRSAHNDIKAQMDKYIPRPRRRRQGFRGAQFVLNTDTVMEYIDGTIIIRTDGEQDKIIPGIRLLQSYDSVFGHDFFYGSAQFRFNGFGVLFVAHAIAQYIQEGVNPLLKPTLSEEQRVEMLLDIVDVMLEVDPNDETKLIPVRKKSIGRRATKSRLNKRHSPSPDQVGSQALNSCNGLTRSVAQLYFSVISAPPG